MPPLGEIIRESQIWKSIIRHPAPVDRRNRVVVMLTNFFLHLHPVSVRKQGIALSYTESGITVASDVSGFYVRLGDNDGNVSPDLANNPGCCSTPYRFTYSGGVFSVAKWDFNPISGTHAFTASSGDVFVPGAGTVSPPSAGWTGITYFT